jgi:tRNA threonylcarbamoyladenosine biosynthesis protein TsaE
MENKNIISIKTHSPKETEDFAAKFAETLRPGDTVAFIGGLGAGKTRFVRGMCQGLNIDPDIVTSPTFTIMNIYEGGKIPLFHFDMYRINSGSDLETTGFYDCEDGIRAVEWSENILDSLPQNLITVKIFVMSESEREIEVADTRD